MKADANKKPKVVPLAERLANIEEARRLRQVKRELDAVSRREKRIARRKKRKDNRSGGSSSTGLAQLGGKKRTTASRTSRSSIKTT